MSNHRSGNNYAKNNFKSYNQGFNEYQNFGKIHKNIKSYIKH